MFNFKKNSLIYGTLLLSFSGLICRGIGFFYRLFLSQTFGEEAMGIFQLTSPVLMLAFSLTCAGTQTAISKYTAACMGLQKESLSKKYLFTGCILSLSLSLLYSMIVYGQAENISIYLLDEKRCAPLLRICALSFPCCALYSCFNGYFYGKKATQLPSFTQITEQLVRVGSVFFLYNYMIQKKQTPTIAITCIGMVLGEVVSFLISFIYYLISFSKKSNDRSSFSFFFPKNQENYMYLTKQLLTLSIPLTLNRVIVNLLQSYEAISIPTQLKAFGYSDKAALSIYGVLTGMALSLIQFPSTFVNSASVLLLPTVSEASSRDNNAQIRTTIQRAVFFSLLLGSGCTLFFYLFGNYCGILLFNSSLAGSFIRSLSFLCPFSYLHVTLSSILNGLKKTKITLFINISALLIRLFFILYWIPQWGLNGYLWGLLISEIFSAGFCIFILWKNHF